MSPFCSERVRCQSRKRGTGHVLPTVLAAMRSSRSCECGTHGQRCWDGKENSRRMPGRPTLCALLAWRKKSLFITALTGLTQRLEFGRCHLPIWVDIIRMAQPGLRPCLRTLVCAPLSVPLISSPQVYTALRRCSDRYFLFSRLTRKQRRFDVNKFGTTRRSRMRRCDGTRRARCARRMCDGLIFDSDFGWEPECTG